MLFGKVCIGFVVMGKMFIKFVEVFCDGFVGEVDYWFCVCINFDVWD